MTEQADNQSFMQVFLATAPHAEQELTDQEEKVAIQPDIKVKGAVDGEVLRSMGRKNFRFAPVARADGVHNCWRPLNTTIEGEQL